MASCLVVKEISKLVEHYALPRIDNLSEKALCMAYFALHSRSRPTIVSCDKTLIGSAAHGRLLRTEKKINNAL
jgi:hypothetical protein